MSPNKCTWGWNNRIILITKRNIPTDTKEYTTNAKKKNVLNTPSIYL